MKQPFVNNRRESPPGRHWTDRGSKVKFGLLTFVACGLSLVAIGVFPAMLPAQEDEIMAASREYRIKAAYLYQFGRYIEWPAKMFPTPQSPFVIGVMEDDSIVADLEQIARAKKIQDRPIKILRFSKPDEIQACHILFLPADMPIETQTRILEKMSQKGVLPVGEADEFLKWGGAIRLARIGNNIRVFIARKAAEREGLSISAKLLQVANVVD